MLSNDHPISLASQRAAAFAAEPEHALGATFVACARLSDALLEHLDADDTGPTLCEHAPTYLAASGALAWATEQAAVTCWPCLLAATIVLAHAAPGNRCDTCDREQAHVLRHVAVAVGPVVALGSVCRKCLRLQQSPPYDAGAAGDRVIEHLLPLVDGVTTPDGAA